MLHVIAAVSSYTPRLTISGTSLGLRALGFVYEYYVKRNTDETISYFFQLLYEFIISRNAIWNARKTMEKLLQSTYNEILEHISTSSFVQLDESPFKMNGKKGYA